MEKKVEDLKTSHTPKAIRQRLSAGTSHSYLKDFIYGAIDGAVTTFAVVSSVAGAGLSGKIVIILGVANLLGDGFSMAVGNYSGTRAEEQILDQTRKMEEHHIREFPEGEKEEIRQIFATKGFEGEDLEKAVKIITSNRNQWIDTMLQEEHGLSLSRPSPMRAAASTFVAFFVVGSIPLLSFVYQWIFPKVTFDPFLLSAILTGIAFFVVGTFKSRFVAQKWYWAGLETFGMGSLAALLAYYVGVFLNAFL